MRLKTLLLPSIGLSLACIPFVAAQCQHEQVQEINMVMPTPWKKGFDINKITFFKNIENEYNKLKQKNEKLKDTPDIKIKPSLNSDNRAVFDSVYANRAQIGFSTSVFLMQKANQSQLNIDKIQTVAQTTTFAPKHDNTPLFYGEDDEAFAQMVNDINIDFSKKPFSQWSDDEYQYKYGIYNTFYDKTRQVNYYRGAIFIAGDDDTISKIKQAWQQKDWKTFKSFGIVTASNSNSNSKYVYPEILFKKHFNKVDNKFTSFAQEKEKNNDLFASYVKGQSAKDMFNFKQHIFLGEEGEYAYHHSDRNSKLFSRPNGERAEILTMTDPISFNILIANNSLSKDQLKLLVSVMMSQKDDFGYLIGVNGYQDSIGKEKEIKDFYLKAINGTN
ncbi:ABC transporter thiamine pyrophosphate-binding lipoprotein p37/Cypl [[Mycoplasma] gypis]|uniref:High affinity transport system protein p37 n=1 Tax=[Mycoplasma] gypis TaxID=92404 RepID=A0ABZ2RPQ9_9BACT|nr:hypothetical protein [[Mycoplasma] gypis]MBN0919609.1 hypothetical protein [[Mycoplasma] gypis]